MFRIDLNTLKCPICEDICFKLLILPCQISICSLCVTALIHEESKPYKCTFCQEIHNLDNLPSNDLLNQELSLLRNEFLTFLSNLEKQIETLEFHLNNPENKIKEYCSQLKNKVQYVTAYKIQDPNEKQTIEQLIESNDQMLNQIDQFEKTKLELYVKSADFELKLIKAKDFCSQWKLLERNDLTLSFDLIRFVYDLKFKLEIDAEILNSLIFSDRILRVNDKDLVYCSTDTIDYNHLKKIDFKKQLTKIKKLYDKNIHLIESFKFRYSGSGCLSNSNIVIAFIMTIHYKSLSEQDYNLCLVQFDKNKSLVRYKLINNIIDSNLIVNSDKCVLDVTLFGSSKECIKIFDSNFTLLSEFKTKNESLIALNDSYIFCVSKDIRKEPINVYDWSFRMVKTIGQRNNLDGEFYFSNEVSYFESFCGKYYVLEEDRNSKQRLFKIFDEFSGNLLCEINLCHDHEVSICTNASKLFIYNSQTMLNINPSGDILKQTKLANFPRKFNLTYDNLKNLTCFDDNFHL